MNSQLSNVLDTLITKMESGSLNFKMPWTASELPHNYQTGRTYSGFNLFITMFSGFTQPGYLTFNQVKALGGHVKKGSKATPIIFWQPRKYDKVNADGTTETKDGLIMRLYHVFNQEQIEGIDFQMKPVREVSDVSEVTNMVAEMGVTLTTSKMGQACYIPTVDRIEMPLQSNFTTDNGYIATLYHEMTHATGHPSRLKRDMKGRFDKNSYSFEELIAELGACFLCAMTGVSNDLDNSAAYMKSWARVIKADKEMLYKAAGKAQKAVNYILNPKGSEITEDEELEVETA